MTDSDTLKMLRETRDSTIRTEGEVAAVNKTVTRLDETVTRLDETVRGNGSPGLLARVAVAEQQISTHRRILIAAVLAALGGGGVAAAAADSVRAKASAGASQEPALPPAPARPSAVETAPPPSPGQ